MIRRQLLDKIPARLYEPKKHTHKTNEERLAFLKELARYLEVDCETIAMGEDGVIHYYFNTTEQQGTN